MSILVIAEHNNKEIKGATLSTIAAASKLGSDIDLLIVGDDISTIIEESKNIDSISKIVSCDDSLYAHNLAENLSKLVCTISSEYSYIMTSATTFGKNLLPRISAKLDVQQISDIISVESEDTFKRPIYAGSCIATVRSNDDVKVISVRATAFDPVQKNNSNVPVSTIDVAGSAGISEFVSEELAKSDRPELTAASIIISGGKTTKLKMKLNKIGPRKLWEKVTKQLKKQSERNKERTLKIENVKEDTLRKTEQRKK
jgi:electron transfer flavoprotein alpha subunit